MDEFEHTLISTRRMYPTEEEEEEKDEKIFGLWTKIDVKMKCRTLNAKKALVMFLGDHFTLTKVVLNVDFGS